MLKKCLKYDLKASLLIWTILSAAMLVMSVPGGLAIRYLDSEINGFITAVSGLVVFVYYLLAVIYLVAGIGLGVYRFYQNFRTDEAYLTFTLPVKRKTLLHSKFIATLITLFSTLAVLFTALMITFAFIPDGEHSFFVSFITKIKDELVGSYESHGFWSVVYLCQVIVLAFEAVSAVILLCFSIANRATSNKNKTKESIGKNLAAVFLVYLGMGLLAAPTVLLIISMISYTEAVDITGTLTVGESNVVTFLTFVMFTMAAVILNVILYKDNLNKIKNKLNLT